MRGMPDLTIDRSLRRARHRAGGAAPSPRTTGPVYMRLLRGNVPLVLDEYDYKFELGKAKLLRDGADVLIISSRLHDHARAGGGEGAGRRTGSTSRVLHVPTIKPLDEETILREAGAHGPPGRRGREPHGHRRPGRGGRGRAAARTASRRRFRQIALPDEFLDAGALPTLHDRYGISTEAMAAASRAGRRSSGAVGSRADTSRMFCFVATCANSRCGPWRAALQCWKREDTMADGRSASGQSASGRSASPQLSRRRLLAGAAAVPLCGILTHGARGAEFEYKLATGQDPTHPVNIRAAEALNRIREATGGKLDIKLFPANQLGSDTDLMSQVRSGSVEFFNQSTSILSTLVPAAGILNTGFAFTDYDAVWKAMDGDLGTYVRAQIAKTPIMTVSRVWDNGFRQITSSTARDQDAGRPQGLQDPRAAGAAC